MFETAGHRGKILRQDTDRADTYGAGVEALFELKLSVDVIT
jgi:hypothetical protein